MKKIFYRSMVMWLALIFWGVTSVDAQPKQVSATVDSSSILIGDQVHMKLSWEVPGNARITWPVFKDTLTGKIEVVQVGKLDSLKQGNDKTKVFSQTITLTCFDSGSFYIPAIPFTYRIPGDTTVFKSESSPMLLNVNTVRVDTTQAIKAIKKPLKIPWTLREILTWVGIGLGIAIVALMVVYILIRKLRKKPIFGTLARPALPAHLQALKDLEELRQQQLWQKGREKEYHSRLSDIIRTYIEARFQIKAMEMISPDVSIALAHQGIDPEVLGMLDQLLSLADMVKFARYQPLPDEHDRSHRNAVGFVQKTLIEDKKMEPVSQSEDVLTKDEEEMP